MEKFLPNVTNFWMIRTEGGKYFNEFTNKNYIGIAWNDFIDLKYIREISLKEFRIKVKEHYGDTEKKPGGAAVQMKTFVSVMKDGDIVIIPGYSSKEVSFGKIISGPFTVPQPPKDKCPFRKRGDVQWFGTYSRRKLDPNLFALLNSHHAITNANPYSSFINRMLFPFYTSGEQAHLTLKVISETPIFFNELLTIMSGLKFIAEDYEKITGDKIDIDSVQMRASFNSPGPIEFFGKMKSLLWALVILHFIVGGNIEIPFLVKIQSPGIINPIMEYLTEDKKIELQSLQIKMQSVTRNKIEIPDPNQAISLQENINLEQNK